MSFLALTQLMTALNDIHANLLELAQQKKQILIKNQVDQLLEILKKENRLIKQVTDLEQQRVGVIGDFMIEKGYKPNPRVTISDLTKIIFNIEEKKSLIDSQKQLLSTIRRLREVNAVNQQLIEQSLAFIDYSLDLIVGPPEDEVTYHKSKSQGYGTKWQGLFDTRA
ncbi:flagellar protein FlgN [Paenibacillus allorhizosphaerae]|uniref:Flagellar protein FlgN n=1 Tax=Paenibacillus allorhizosphaerae TaxID=2849866 RepID=A0ABN7TWT8_9BACL|nr:flagellar protein FlgN [Paenibacillus allorhizosphaerae]CAG7655463.1 putative protein YvyG [Paenibacillus allorhizosphaerae]